MTVPQSTLDLTTVAAVQGYLNTSLATTNDTIQVLVTNISRWIMSFCARDFRLAAYNEQRNGRGGDTMLLANFPISSVTSVAVDGQTIPPALGPPWTAGYVNDDMSVYLFCPYSFTRNKQNVQFSYMAGYITPGMFGLNPGGGAVTLPEDLQQAVIESVAERFKRRDSIGILAKALAGETISYSQADLPKSAAPVIDAYRKVALTI